MFKRIIAVLVFSIFISFPIFVFGADDSAVSSEDACMSTAERFLKAWTERDYETMYSSLSEGMDNGEMDREEFIETYKGKEAEVGSLADYSIKQAGGEDKYSALLKFQTDVPLRTISSVHTFKMERGDGDCLVGKISPLAPSAPSRLPGGGNPGE